MCDRCGSGAGAHDIALTERPAHRLVGYFWEGTFAQAREGAVQPVLLKARALSDSVSGLWRSPIVGLSWNDRPDGFRYFAGIVGEDAPEGGGAIDLPEMTFASSWHGADDGEVVQHYMRMIEWMGDESLSRDTERFAQREEYPNDYDPAAPLSLRLLLPIKPTAS